MSNQSAGTSFHMENFKRRSRYAMVFILLILAFGLITVLNINTGNVHISLSEIIDILLKKATDTKEYSIIWKIRLPRILMAAILGGALSLSGFLLQTFFENPIAGPFVLGISSGAKMVVALTMIYYLGRAVNVTSYTLIIAAFIGSLISIGFILLISKRIKHMATLLVAGIMIGYICSAVTDFVVTFADDSDIVNLHGWSQGSFSGMSWSNVYISCVVVGITLVLDLPAVKAHRCLSAGRSLCTKHGRKYQILPCCIDFAFQYFISNCNCFCRTDFFRWNCSPISDEKKLRHIQTTYNHSGNIPGRCSFLYDV